MTPPRPLPEPQPPLLDFEETRQANLALFQQTTPEERVRWLGHMLELLRLARLAREQSGPRDAAEDW